MRVFRARLAERFRSSLWVIPAVCTLVAALLAFALVQFDKSLDENQPFLPIIFQGNVDSARAVLSTIAGSMISVAGIIYSLTIVALALASQQFAPRVLRSFVRDRGNQVVLGFFVATFAFCLLVLRDVGGPRDDDFVPGTAVAGGVLLALISLGMLIYFIDHIFRGIQVANIISNIASETVKQIDAIYPYTWQDDDPEPNTSSITPEDWAAIPSNTSGYVQYIDYDSLFNLAVESGAVLRDERAIGSFVIAATPLASVHPSDKLTSVLQARVNESFVTGAAPTLQQDVAYGIRQIVDVALKAISPAVNDPTTAMNCIDNLGVILATLAARRLPDLDRVDETGQVRLIIRERKFSNLTRLAFDQIRHYGAKDPIVVIRMLDTITQVASIIRNLAYKAALMEQVEHIEAAAEHELVDRYEIEVVRARVKTAREACQPDKL